MSFCVGGWNDSETKNQKLPGKLSPQTKKVVNPITNSSSICGWSKSQNFTKNMTKGSNSEKKKRN